MVGFIFKNNLKLKTVTKSIFFNVKKLKRTYVILASLSLSFVTNSNAQVIEEYHADMNMDALRFWYSDPNQIAYKFNRDISPKGDCIQVINGYLFFAWFRGGMADRHVMLSRLNLSTKNWVTIEFPNQSTLFGSGEYKDAGDSHKTAAVGVCPVDNTVHLVYDMHCDPLKYRVSQKNIAFAPDNQFVLSSFSNQRDYFKAGEPIASFTYPSFEINNAGELIVEYRIGTSRQGDKYITYYDGDTWSSIILLVKGNNENPQFNQYGGFSYQFGKMYLGCCVREYGSPITYNYGFYFAEAGQRGNETWKNLSGQKFTPPIRGLKAFNNFKICEPLPDGHDGMTSGPQLVVSKNGAIHMTNRVSGVGTVHYYTEPGSTDLIEAGGSSAPVSFGGNDGRIYSVDLNNGKIRVQSTPEGHNNWRTDYTWSGSARFGIMSSEYYKGKIYIIAGEGVDSDKRPLHIVILKLDGVTPVTNKSVGVATPGTIHVLLLNKNSLTFRVLQQGRYALTVYSIDGQRLINIPDKDYMKGLYTVNLTGNILSGGMYIIEAKGCANTNSRKIFCW